MTQAKTESFACAEIAVQEPALIRIRLFDGKELELDLSPFQFKSAKESREFLIKMLSNAMHDTMILANLRPVRPAKLEPWGCKANE